jgi:hypothetical protein
MSDSDTSAPYFPDRLAHYQDARINIHYTDNQHTDVGRLLYRDHTWIELLKDNGEHLLIPVMAIRIIKLLQPAQTTADANILLRAAESGPQKQITGEK